MMVIPADKFAKDEDKPKEETIDNKIESTDDGHVDIDNKELGGEMSDELYRKYEKAGYDVERKDDYTHIKPR